MKPIVGVTPLWDEEQNSLWMLPDYLNSVIVSGGVPMIFPFTDDEEAVRKLAEKCDGFLFTGGQDVSPALYHEEALEGLTKCCGKRDVLEAIVLREALRLNKPILGICRGIQFINAALGGSLYQDIPLQRSSQVIHRQPVPYNAPSHTVELVSGSPIQLYLKRDCLEVNSCHHQGVRETAPGLLPMAYAEDGLIEALYMPGRRFFWAVQWHPEMMFEKDSYSQKIFKAFIESMEPETEQTCLQGSRV